MRTTAKETVVPKRGHIGSRGLKGVSLQGAFRAGGLIILLIACAMAANAQAIKTMEKPSSLSAADGAGSGIALVAPAAGPMPERSGALAGTGNVIDVGPGYSNTTIGGAMGYAADGDTIRVHSGTYYESVYVYRSVTIVGVDDGGGKPIVDAGGNYGFYIGVNGVTIDGFAIRNGINGYGYGGVTIASTGFNTITNNTITGTSNAVIFWAGSNNNLVANNDLSGCNDPAWGGTGIYVWQSNNNQILNNTVANDDYGIAIVESASNVLRDNNMSGCSINFLTTREAQPYNDIDTSNTVNDKPIYYLVGLSRMRIDGSMGPGVVYLYDCSDMTVEGVMISDVFTGIELQNTTDSTVSDCVLYNNTYGLFLNNSSNTIVDGNVVVNSSTDGFPRWDGITIAGNDSAGTAVARNTVIGYSEVVMYGEPGNGIDIIRSAGLLFTNNQILGCMNGISIWNSSGNTFYLNDVRDNVQSVNASNSESLWSTPAPVTYRYNGDTYTGRLGNHWGDYAGNDGDGDGVGTPGYSNVTMGVDDQFPLIASWIYYDVLSPAPDAAYVSDTIPPEMVSGETYDVSVTFENTGTMPWSESELVRMLSWGDTAALGIAGDCDNHGCGYPEYAIGPGITVLPGEEYTFNFTMAPAGTGTYTIGMTMAQNGAGTGVSGFGTPGYRTVTVAPSGFDVSQANALFVNSTIPSTVMLGHTYNVSITFENTGANAWSEADLVRMLAWGDTAALGIAGDCDNHGCGYPEYAIAPGTTVQPGESYTFSFTMTPVTAGYASLGMIMAHNGNGSEVTGFGGAGYQSIIVTPARFDISLGNAWYQSNTMPSTMTVGQTYNVSVTFMNDGWAPWSEADSVRLLGFGDTAAMGMAGDCDNYSSGYPEYAIAGDPVLLWQLHTWNFTVTPTAPGNYTVGFAMVQNDGSTVTPFGGYGYATVTVEPA